MSNAVVTNAGRKSNLVLFTRRFLAAIALSALIIGLLVYVMSFHGLVLEKMSGWFVALHVGIFALLIPMCAIENSAIQKRYFFWKGFNEGKPIWIPNAIKLLGFCTLLHFALFLVLSHGAAPQVINGEFVLNNHGRIIKKLSEAQYFNLKGYELRLFAAGWIFFYSVASIYWWFPSPKQSESQSGI